MLTQPKIKVCREDYDALYALADRLPDSAAVERLLDELERAEILERHEMPADVVTMHTTVTFTILSTQKVCTYTLVYPHEATSDDKLSILTPVGSALLGLSVGQEIEWPLQDSKSTRVRIDAIVN